MAAFFELESFMALIWPDSGRLRTLTRILQSGRLQADYDRDPVGHLKSGRHFEVRRVCLAD